MRVEVLAVGTELLLGQIVDTNSAWLGEQLALAGVDSHFHQVVGDNQARIVLALRTALARGDGVVVCGGLGPTHDDITRDAIAEVMNVPLERDQEVVDRIAVGRHGISIPARSSAKLKTLVQGVAILLCLAPSVAPHHRVLDVAIWVAVAFTVVTGVQYLLDGRRAAQELRR